MSQHDLDIANQTFPNTRSDLNDALQALGSTSSGATVPSTTYANQLWYDTANNKLYIRNEDNDANIEICELDQTNDSVEFFKSDSVRTALVEYTDGTDALTVGSGGELTTSSTLDVDGNELILDADGDTSITADTDDQIDIRIGGADDFAFKANTFEVQTGSNIDMNGTELILDSDGDTSITADTDDQVDIKIGGTDRFKIASTGEVTVTHTVSSGGLDVICTNGGTNGSELEIYHNSSSPADNDNVGFISARGNNSVGGKVTMSQIRTTATDITDGTEDAMITFFTVGNGTLAERMRLDSSGRLLINRTTNYNNEILQIDGGTSTALRLDNDGTSLFSLINFSNANGIVGTIKTTGLSTQYNTSSDYRLKENVDYSFDATTRLKQLKPCRFNFIADADKTVDGFIAHEVSDIVPEAISGEKDAMMTEEYEVTPAVLDDDGNIVEEAVMGTREVPDYQGIDQSKLVPLLVKTIQELEARITILENN